jgi:hypothetical protein
VSGGVEVTVMHFYAAAIMINYVKLWGSRTWMQLRHHNR